MLLVRKEIKNAWALAGIAAAPFYILLIIALGALEPGYSHLTMPMSILGGVPDPRGLIFNLGVLITGAFVIAFGIGLRSRLPLKWSARIGCGLLALGGLGLIGAGIFPCREGCRNIFIEPDSAGRIHMIAAFVSGMGTGLAPLFLWAAMRGEKKWKDCAVPTMLAAAFSNLPGIAFWLMRLTEFRVPSLEGLIQRMGFVVVLIWMFYISLKSPRSPPSPV